MTPGILLLMMLVAIVPLAMGSRSQKLAEASSEEADECRKKSFFLLFSFQPAVTIILSVTSIKRLIVREERLVLRLLVAELLQLPQEG